VALRYRTICTEGAQFGRRAPAPEVDAHARCTGMQRLDAGDLQGVDLMLASAVSWRAPAPIS
jgi:hypothetical protein